MGCFADLIFVSCFSCTVEAKNLKKNNLRNLKSNTFPQNLVFSALLGRIKSTDLRLNFTECAYSNAAITINMLAFACLLVFLLLFLTKYYYNCVLWNISDNALCAMIIMVFQCCVIIIASNKMTSELRDD